VCCLSANVMLRAVAVALGGDHGGGGDGDHLNPWVVLVPASGLTALFFAGAYTVHRRLRPGADTQPGWGTRR
jgi:hypothetical protein